MIAFGPRPPVVCTVQDFCEAGMFIALAPEITRTLSPQTDATLHVALVVGGVHQEYQMRVAVARVIANGIGVMFVEPDPEVIRLLSSLVASSSGQRQRAQDKAQGPSFAPEFAAVVEPLAQHALTWARGVLKAFTTEADNALFIGARDAKSNRDQSMYFDAQTKLRKQQDAIAQEVCERIERGVRTLSNPLQEKLSETQGRSFKNLSLVEKDEFEDFLTVSEIVSSIEPKLREPLFQLEKRLSYLANRTLDGSNNPLGPAVVCETLASALRGLEADRRGLNVVYKTLGVTVSTGFAELVNRANTILIEQGILPVLEREVPLVKRSAAAAKTTRKKPEDAERGAPVEALTSTLTGLAGTLTSLAAGERAAEGVVRHGPPAMPGQGPVVPVQAGPAAPAVAAPAAEGGSMVSGVQAATPALARNLAPEGYAVGQPLAFSHGAAYVAPSFNRAYNAAQTLMSLRRELTQAEVPAAGLIAPPSVGVAYAPSQLVDGLTALQAAGGAQELDLLGVEDIKSRLVDVLGQAGVARQQIGPREADAIEVIANLFKSLIDDALVTDSAKAQIRRMQPSMHKVGLLDPSFFEASDHPARLLLNRVASVRDAVGPEGAEELRQVGALIDRLNREFRQDTGIFTELLADLDRVLSEQRGAYEANLREVVKTCEEQQLTLKARRSDHGAADSSRSTQELPAEWHRWLKRGKELKVGDRVLMDANRPNPQQLTVAWIGEDFDPYVFADSRGRKAQTLTLQQVAMYLRRGILKLVEEHHLAPVDRALYGMLHRMHGQLEREVTHDQVTGLLNQKNFLEQVARHLPAAHGGRQTPVLAQLYLHGLKDVEAEAGSSAVDDLRRHLAEVIEEVTARHDVVTGMIKIDRLGLFARSSTLQGVYKMAERVLQKMEMDPVKVDGRPLRADAWCGICAVTDPSETVEQLLSRADAACKSAEQDGTRRIFIAGHSETRARAQFEQLVAYVGKAIERGRLVLMHRTLKPVTAGIGVRPTLQLVIGAHDRSGKLIPPDMFMRAVASTPDALKVDHWVIREALKWMAEHSERMDDYDSLVIPLSHAAVKDDMLTQFIVNELMATPVPPGKVCFSMNDADASGNLAESMELVRTLREFGCRFVLEEFGSGQSSYDYVRDLQVDFVTIQSLFVNEGSADPKELAMVKSINELAHFMGKRTIAKLKPTVSALDRLRAIGVDFIHELIDPLPLPQA